MPENNEESIEAQLAALQAHIADLEETIPSTQKDLWGDGIASDLTEGAGGLVLGDKVSFGYKIDGTTVTIYASEINGNAVAQTDVTPSAGDNEVYVRITKADGTALVAVAASVPTNTSTYRYYRLYNFNRTGDTVTLTNVARPFLIEDGLPNGGAEYQVLVLDSDVEQTFGWVTKDSIKATGVAQYKVLQADASGNAVWDWVRAHS